MSTQRKRVGFTIVELIIVVAVIAILAGITIIGYRGVVDRGRTASVTSALKDASGKLKLNKFDNGAYPTTGNLASAGVTDTNDVKFQYTSDGTAYCLTATNNNVSYKISANGTPISGGCAGHGANGVAAITNLSPNPSVESNLTDIGGYYGPTITRDTSTAASGVASVLATTVSTTNPEGLIFTISRAAPANQQYTCSVALAGTPGAQVYLSGRIASSADAYISEGVGSKTVTLSSTFARSFIQFTTPNPYPVGDATKGIVRIQVRVPSPVSGVSIRADAIMCTTGTTVYQYADGSSANWGWTGTVNNSSSTGMPL